MDCSPPAEDSSLPGIQFQNIPLTPSQDVTSPDTHPQSISLPQKPRRVSRHSRRLLVIVFLLSMSLIIIVSSTLIVPALKIRPVVPVPTLPPRAVATSTPTPIPTPVFDPGLGAVLPTHRVVAFYAVPYAEPTGPAYEPTDTMLAALRQQGAAYEQLDPGHPVQLGIDLVVSVPDAFPGPQNSYSHHVDAGTIQSYIDFCSKNDLLLFLDLDFGQSPIMNEVNFFLPYLEKYAFVHMAIDPEWMFPRRNGIPMMLGRQRLRINETCSSIRVLMWSFMLIASVAMLAIFRIKGFNTASGFNRIWKSTTTFSMAALSCFTSMKPKYG